MFTLQTYKGKVYLAGILTIILLLFCIYPLTIKKTLVEKHACDSLIEQAQLAQTAELEIMGIKQKLAQLESKIETTASENKSYQEYLLDRISRYTKTHNLLITNFPAQSSIQEENMIIETYQISVQGSFIPLLQLLYYIETSGVAAKVSGVVFYTQKNMETHQSRLFMGLYIQTIATAKQAVSKNID